MSTIKLTWSQSTYPINWSDNPYLWSDVAIVIEAVESIGGSGIQDWQKKNPEKKKRLIKLLVAIDSKKYEQQKYKRESIVLTVKDIRLLEQVVLQKKKVTVEVVE